jgi:RNA polymerase sigma-70 factor, ECF subfamily
MDFRQVYKDYYPKIFRYLTRLGIGREEAEDLTQEVFIKVSEALSEFEGRPSLLASICKKSALYTY